MTLIVSLAGAVQLTVAVVLANVELAVPSTSDAIGVIELDAVDAEPEPTEFVAVTVNVYAVFKVRPANVADVAVPEAVCVVVAGELTME